MSSETELFALAADLENLAQSEVYSDYTAKLVSLEKMADQVGRAFGGSWLGYYSTIYYDSLKPPPAGAHFSQEWGMKELYSGLGTKGKWREYDLEELLKYIRQEAGADDLTPLEAEANELPTFSMTTAGPRSQSYRPKTQMVRTST